MALGIIEKVNSIGPRLKFLFRQAGQIQNLRFCDGRNLVDIFSCPEFHVVKLDTMNGFPGGGGYSVERWVRGCVAQIGCIFSPTGFSMTPFYFKTRNLGQNNQERDRLFRLIHYFIFQYHYFHLFFHH